MSRPLKTDGDGAFVHTLALSPCLVPLPSSHEIRRRFALLTPVQLRYNSGTTPAETVLIPEQYRSCNVVYIAISIRTTKVA